MVHKFQELDNYDDYDSLPYQGEYDQEAAYGSVKPADEVSGYRRIDYGAEEEEQEIAYGNEHNPCGRGPPERPRPGGVYRGGCHRNRPDPYEAQPDEGVETAYGGGYGQHKPGYGKHPHGEEFTVENEGYRPSYGEEEETEEGYGGGHGHKKYGKENDGKIFVCGNERHRRKDDDEEEEQRHGRNHHKKKHDDEEEGVGEEYGGRRRTKKDSDDEDSDESDRGRLHKKKDSDDEDSDESDRGRRHKKKHDDDDDESEEGGHRFRRDNADELSEEKKSWW